jgi:serine/threonine-protein kinase
LRATSRFEFEAEVTGGLEHPGIVPVYGLGHTPDGRPFYAMRFIKGSNLKEAVRRFHQAEKQPGRDPGQSLLELRELLGRFMDVCDAVAYAHSRGVLHRDLKPGNIMLGKYGETLVVDWGLAKALGHPESEGPIERSELPLKPASGSALEPTQAGSAVGTPGYMSPEQVDGRVGKLGVRSDVYCLGATLYHLLTGHAPCEGEQRGEIDQKVLAGDIPRPRLLNPRIAPALEAICLKALALQPEDRYESPQALKADLERWLAGEPVGAYPEPVPTRAMRWVRRHKPWIAAAAGLFLMALLGLAVHDWQIGREKVRTADQLGMTRDALRQLLGLAGVKLAEIPNTEPLRQELAQLVFDKYGQLGERFPNDPSVRLEKAHVLRVIAGIKRITGQFAESDKSYDQAIEILTALCASERGRFEYRRWLVEALVERGALYRMNGKIRRAEELFNSAIAHSERLLLQPISTPYRRAKGSALINLSDILVLENRLPEARQRADQAVELLKPIALEEQNSKQASRDRWLLSMALTNRGIASQEERDHAAAGRDFHEAEAVAKPITDENDPFYDDLQFQLACIDNHRGEPTRQGREPLDDHESALERAFQRLTKLAEKHKLMPHYREELAVTLSHRAAVKLARRRLAEAQADCQAAIGLLEHLIAEQARKGAPENPQYFSLLGRATVLAGRIQEQQGHRREGRLLRDKGAESLRRAVQIDEARAQDKQILDQLQAEIDRDISGEK